MATSALQNVFVTGGNTGIGFALCKQLATGGCFVYLGSRNKDKGEAAVKAVLDEFPKAKIKLVIIDVSSDDSVKKAANELADKDIKFYGLVNNAGVGLSHGVDSQEILNVNLKGPKRVFEAFLPLLDPKKGRVVNVSSGCASAYMKGSMSGKPMGGNSLADKKDLLSWDVTWEQIMSVVARESKASGGKIDSFAAYGLSKAGLCAYTMLLAKKFPHITSSSCSPGFIKTNMTKGFGAKLSPDQGTVSLKHCLLNKLGGNGWYFGSDGKRSPLDQSRNPGDPEYNPTD